MPEDVEKIVLRVGKVRTRCTRCNRGVAAPAAWVVGMRRCAVLQVVIARVRTAPTTRRQLVVSESAAVP